MDEQTRWVQEQGPAVWRSIARLLGRRDDALADCFQETFLEFWPQRYAAKDAGALLRQIATRRALDVIRQRCRNRQRSEPFPSDPPTSADPGAQLHAEELVDQLAEALNELPEQQAAAFCLTQLELLEPQRAAAALNVTPSHLAVLLHRARTFLRDRLAAYAPRSLKR